MLIRFAIFPLVFVLGLSTCRKQTTAVAPAASPSPASSAAEARPPSEASGGTSNGPAAPNAASGGSPAALTKSGKTVVDQTAQVIVYRYHRFVEKVKRPDTEITPAVFEAQMKELKDRGITVIPMQDFLAWKRSEKSIPPRCAVITFDDGWKSQ